MLACCRCNLVPFALDLVGDFRYTFEKSPRDQGTVAAIDPW